MSKKEKNFTPEEIGKMREIIASQEHEKAREFDLNHPELTPGIIPNYRFQEYPKTLYNHATGKIGTVESAEDEQVLLDAGWSTKPKTDPGAEAARRGRPPKIETKE